jgi:PBP1b-binding outer membrane lipoprotein LpoB
MLNLRRGCLSLVIASMLLVGCSSQEFKDNQKKNDEIQQEIATRSTTIKNKKVDYITLPPVTQRTIVEKVDTAWLDTVVTVNVADMPLSIVIEEIMNGVGLPIWFSEEVDTIRRT